MIHGVPYTCFADERGVCVEVADSCDEVFNLAAGTTDIPAGTQFEFSLVNYPEYCELDGGKITSDLEIRRGEQLIATVPLDGADAGINAYIPYESISL